ncbi:MAG: formate dehydrogenase accessory sulfurtransferase FdhD [Gemmatimonadota bacterium]
MDSKQIADTAPGVLPVSPAAPEAVVRLESTDGEPLAEWLCTPDRLGDLAVGWLFSEGIIRGRDEISNLDVASPRRVRVELSGTAQRRLCDRRSRKGPGPAPRDIGSGAVEGPYRPKRALEALLSDAARLGALFRELFEGAALRSNAGGGIHTGARVLDGRIVDVVEDVSRSAVIDKLVGSAVLDGGMPEQPLFLLSGRISASIAAKLATAGVAAAATISIPTTLAVEIAGRSGVALVGRARRDSPYRYGTG